MSLSDNCVAVLAVNVLFVMNASGVAHGRSCLLKPNVRLPLNKQCNTVIVLHLNCIKPPVEILCLCSDKPMVKLRSHESICWVRVSHSLLMLHSTASL